MGVLGQERPGVPGRHQRSLENRLWPLFPHWRMEKVRGGRHLLGERQNGQKGV